MRALVDAQALLWFAQGDERTPLHVRQWLESPENQRVFSAVSAWEIIIKCMSRKLHLDRPPLEFLDFNIRNLAMETLEISMTHVYRVNSLPAHHRDPFDRLLVAQAMIEQLPIVTGDPMLRRYDIKTIW